MKNSAALDLIEQRPVNDPMVYEAAVPRPIERGARRSKGINNNVP